MTDAPRLYERINVYETTITPGSGSGVSTSTINFRSKGFFIVVKAASDSTTFKFNITESDDFVILNRTKATYTGRHAEGWTYGIPLIGLIKVNISSASADEEFKVKIYYE